MDELAAGDRVAELPGLGDGCAERDAGVCERSCRGHASLAKWLQGPLALRATQRPLIRTRMHRSDTQSRSLVPTDAQAAASLPLENRQELVLPASLTHGVAPELHAHSLRAGRGHDELTIRRLNGLCEGDRSSVFERYTNSEQA